VTISVGRVEEIWRYPIKSMGGEKLDSCRIERRWGIPGDRGWAVRDEQAGEIRGAKKIPSLLRCRARYTEEPRGDASPTVEIALSDGRAIRSDAADVSELLSTGLGREVTLWPRRPADDLAHYRRAVKLDEAEIRAQLGLLPDESLPRFGDASPPELAEFTSPPGTYFDAFELHLLTRTSLARLAQLLPDSHIDVRRFRPNLLIDTGAAGLPELDWCGQTLRIGALRLHVVQPTVRCVMTTCAQADLSKDPRIMRTLVRNLTQRLGVGASVIEPGEVRVGDPVELS